MKCFKLVWWQDRSCFDGLLCAALMILVVSGCTDAPVDVPAATDNSQDVLAREAHREQLFASSDGNLVFVEMTEDMKKEVERSSFFGAASDVLSDYTATPWIMRDKCFEVADGELNTRYFLYLIGREKEGETELSGLLFVFRLPGGVAGSTLDGFIYSFVSPDTIRMDFPFQEVSLKVPAYMAAREGTEPQSHWRDEFNDCLNELHCFKRNPLLCMDCCNDCLSRVGFPSAHSLVKKCGACIRNPGWLHCGSCFFEMAMLPVIGASAYGCLLSCCGVKAFMLD